MIDPSSSEDESDEESIPKRKTGKKQTLVNEESDAKDFTLSAIDAPILSAHPPNRLQDLESKPQRSR